MTSQCYGRERLGDPVTKPKISRADPKEIHAPNRKSDLIKRIPSSPCAYSSIHSASFAVHSGYPSPCLTRALRFPWARQCLSCPLLLLRVAREVAFHEPVSVFPHQLTSSAWLGYPSSRIAVVALRPYLMWCLTVLVLRLRSCMPFSKRNCLLRTISTTSCTFS